MIEKDEFLEWRRIEFAISAELERHFGHTIGFACCVDSERVGFAFCDAYHGVVKRRREENQRAEYQDEQWKAGGISNPAHAPFVAPTPDRRVE